MCESHFEATATHFEFFEEDQGFPGAHPENPLRFLLAANSRCRRALFFRPRGPMQPGVFARRQMFFESRGNPPKRPHGDPNSVFGTPRPPCGKFYAFLKPAPFTPEICTYLGGPNRRDWSVRNSKCFCRVFHLWRNDGIASKIIARDPF